MTQIYLTDIPKNIDIMKYETMVRKNINIDINYKNIQTLTAWILLLKILEIKGYKNIKFRKNKHNKPYLIEIGKFFNISHSYEKVVLALSDEEIGIDIEKILNPNLKIIDRFFTEMEKKYIFMDNNYIKIKERFYIIWTLKESYLKYKGTGLSEKLSSFNIDIINYHIKIIKKNKELLIKLGYKKIDDYILSYCMSDAFFEIKKVDISEVLK